MTLMSARAAIARLNSAWDLLRFDAQYNRVDDPQYWQHRVAAIVGGVVSGEGRARYSNGGDVSAHGLSIEVKMSSARIIDSVDRRTNSKAFRFTRLRSGAYGKEERSYKAADLLICVGVCECSQRVHYWIGSYHEAAAINVSACLKLHCPHLSANRRKQIPNNGDRVLTMVAECDLGRYVQAYAETLYSPQG